MPVLDYANDLMKIIILEYRWFYVDETGTDLGEITAFLTYSVFARHAAYAIRTNRDDLSAWHGRYSSAQTILNAKIPELDEQKLSELDVWIPKRKNVLRS